MAESDFSRTSYGGVPRAEVRIVTPPDLDAAWRTIKDDGHTYEPLAAPGLLPSGFVPPPTPTEQQLRERLTVALGVAGLADERLALAEAAHDRAEAHRQRCETALHSFDGLDDDAVVEETIEQLVGDTVPVELSADMRARIAERERGRISHAAALRASEQLTRDHHAAREAATEAGRRVDTVIVAVLGFTAERIAERHAELLAEAAAHAERLHAFNQFAASRSNSMPQTVRAVLGNDTATLARRRDQTCWREAAAALRADPMAVVEIITAPPMPAS